MLLNQLSLAAERQAMHIRDLADQDYILARMAFRYELDSQFHWVGHQAVEKYLKALLLLNGLSAAGIDHDLGAALQRLESISDIPFNFPRAVEEIGGYLSTDRYGELPVAVSMRRITQFDECVWHVRRYCLNLRGNSSRRLRITPDEAVTEIARRSDRVFDEQPHTYSIFSGYLERVLRDRLPIRRYLVWQNLYFSPLRRTSSRFDRQSLSRPPLANDPRIAEELRGRLQLSKETKRRLGRS